MRLTLGGVTLQVVQGDITYQPDIEAIVDTASAAPTPDDSGDAAAGLALEEDDTSAPIAPGAAVLTEAFDLPNRFVIHCLGPVYGQDEPSEELLTNCYVQALTLAEDHKIGSIAFPAISTGAFGFPFQDASSAASRAIVSRAPDLREIRLIRFVLPTDADCNAFSQALIRSVAAAQQRAAH